MSKLQESMVRFAHIQDVDEALQGIVRTACDFFDADMTALWAYESANNLPSNNQDLDNFILKQSVAYGFEPEMWERFKQFEPQPAGTARTTLEQGWIGIENVADEEQYAFIGETTRSLLTEVGIQGFQGVALAVGQEQLGVLYMNYKRKCQFTHDDEELARQFAGFVAEALKRIMLDKQRRDLEDAGNLLVKVSTQEDTSIMLNMIVREARQRLGCDAATLYIYDQENDHFDFPPAMENIHFPEEVIKIGRVISESVVGRVLALDEMHISNNPQQDRIVRGAFVKREDVQTSVSIPLIIKTQKRRVGVLFLNCRHPHRFRQEELQNIRIFSEQVAIAVYNVQLSRKKIRQVQRFEALYNAGRALENRSLDTKSILDEIAQQVGNITKKKNRSVIPIFVYQMGIILF